MTRSVSVLGLLALLLGPGLHASAADQPWSRRGGKQLSLTLEDSVAVALQHNLRVQIANLGRDSVELGVPLARAAFDPVVGVSYLESSEETFPEAAPMTDTDSSVAAAFVSKDLSTGGNVVLTGELMEDEAADPFEHDASWSISWLQPLLRGGRTFVATRGIQDARFDVGIEEARLRAEILRVTEETRTAYYNAILAEQIIAVTEAAIERDRALIEASEALYEAGIVTRRDVYSAKIILAEDSAALARTRGELEQAKNALLDVLGIPIGTDVELLDKELGVPQVSITLDDWVATAVVNRPEVLEIEEQLEKSFLNIRVARSNRLPQLDLVAAYGRAHDGRTQDEALDFDGESWTAGVVFSIPVGNVAARASVARARTDHARLERQLEQSKRLVELEVREAVIKLQTSLDRMAALRVGVEQAQGKLEIAKERFALGLDTNLDITDAQEDLLDLETDLLTAIVDYNIGLAELEARMATPIETWRGP